MDDLIFTSRKLRLFDEFKTILVKEFEMEDIILISYYKSEQEKYQSFISQEAYGK